MTPPARRASVLAVVLTTLLALSLLPVLLRPGDFIQDDSYFYLQISSHIVAGDGSTFHGITPTNGYHPLWMAGVVGAMALAGGDKGTALHLVVLLQVLLIGAAILLFRRLADRLAPGYWLPGLVVLASYLIGTGLYASEAHLSALTLLAAMLSLWRTLSSDDGRGWFWTGVLFGAAILARLDNVFVAFAMIGFGLLQDRPIKAATLNRRAAHAALGGAAIVAPYLLCNFVSFGHLMPISGAIKSQFPHVVFNLDSLGDMGKLAVPFGLACIPVGLLLEKDPPRRGFWLGIGTGVLLHALYVVAWTDHYTFWAWYYVAAAVAASLAACRLTAWAADGIRPQLGDLATRRLVAVSACVLLAGFTARAWLKAYGPFDVAPLSMRLRINEYRWPEELAQWMKASLPSDSIVFAQDWPGAIAYFSDIAILPMDGLVNDFSYNDELLALGVDAYLCGRGVDYFLGHLGNPAQAHRIAVSAPLYRRPAGVLALSPEQLVVETRAVLKRPQEAPPFAIWRTPCKDR